MKRILVFLVPALSVAFVAAVFAVFSGAPVANAGAHCVPGFVSGEGWIDADTATDRVQRANFGFVAKLRKGLPVGDTQFQFRADDVKFLSTSYDALCVESESEAWFSGYGTLNGAGSYPFLLYVEDLPGGDYFSIQIDGNVLYSNNVGGGDIVIHTK